MPVGDRQRMSQYGSNKNPPWARSGGGQQGMMSSGGSLSQSMLSGGSGNQLLQYPQAQMFSNQMGFQNQVYSNVGMGGAVSYPTRNQLNSAAFQSSGHSVQSSRGPSGGQSDNQNKSQRVFTGTVTKLQDNFGFVDENVFFQTSCCVKGSNPQIGDRVLVEAIYNATMPFKWNATRIQVLPNMNQDEKSSDMDSGGRFSGGNSRFSGSGGKMNPMRNKNFNQPNRKPGMDDRKRPMKDNKFADKKSFGDRMRERSPDRAMDRSLDRSGDRSRGRTPEQRSMSKSPMRDHKRSKSPVRSLKRRRQPPRYAVAVPKYPVVSYELDASDIKRRFTNMYIPSDFMLAKASWINSFPVDKPFSIDFPCKFHIFSKEVDPIGEKMPAEPSDVDYLFSAKVVLLSSPGLEDLLSRCVDDELEEPIPLGRTVSILVGNRGREPLALGGPWSPSVDGPDPETDPGVLVRTAVRNVRALTGIDLSNCTQWYRFLEIYYFRGETVHKGKTVPARVETVVLFIPDVWSCLPTRDEWTSLQESYRAQMNRKLNGEEEPEETAKDDDEEEEESENAEDKPTRQPTHHSLIDPKTIQMNELKEELEARNLSPKGLKNQLIARLTKALKTEAEEEEKKKNEEEEAAEKKKKDDEDKKKREQESKHHESKKEETSKTDEKERINLERKYKMPDAPHILVHPDRTAKSGRFDCSLMTLSSLLNYRPDDNKEHSYELFLFAEAFNSMLVRDFGNRILQTLHEVVITKEAKEKKKEIKESKEKEKEAADAKKKESEEVEEIEDEEVSSEKGSVKEKEEKKEEKIEEPVIKMIPDKELLLAFQYFDTNRCGYIQDKDMEELLSSLGLVLSRAQIKRLIQKIVEKDSIHYKKIAEKPAEPDEAEELLEFQSNRELMPTFDGEETTAANQTTSDHGSGYITFKGKLIDVEKLLEQLSRNEMSRSSTERMYEDLSRTHNNLRDQYDRITRNLSDTSDELRKTKSSLMSANNEISTLQTRSGKYMSVIYQVKNCVEPIIRENSSSHAKGNTKWDKKDIKKEAAEDTKVDSKKKTSDESMDISDNENESKAKSSVKVKKEDKAEKTKPEKQADDTKSTAKSPGTESDRGTEKVESDNKETAKKAPAEVSKKEPTEKPTIKKDDAVSVDEVSDEKEDASKEEQEEENESKGNSKGDEASEVDETANDKEDLDDEEVAETPRKRRKVNIPTPKKATPARRSAKKT